jgi:hypothetical protein
MPDRQVLDLTTGTTRRLRPPNPRWEVQGSWSADGKRALYVEDRVTTVLSWPTLTTEATFRHQDHVPVDQDVALSADGRLLAVNSNQVLSVYRADGTRAWSTGEEAQPTLGRVRIGGRAAWHADGRLTVFARTDLVCEVCGEHPGTWRLRFVDGTTGAPVPGAEYPPVRSAIEVNVVAWRGEVAYAVVAVYHGDAAETAGVGDPDRVELVRLRPGAPAPESLLTAPEGTTWLGVATDFLDTRRPAGAADYGFNRRELMGRVVTGAACLAPFLIGLGVVLVTWVRRSRVRPGGAARARPARP